MRSQRQEKSIAFITGQLGLGGAEKQLFLLSSGLQMRGWRVSVVSLNGHSGDYWEQPLRERGVTLFTLPFDTSKAFRVRKIQSVLQRQKPRIVHSWTIYANIYAALSGRLSRAPYRVGSERSNHAHSRDDVGEFWYSLSLRGLDGLVTNSDAAGDYLRRYRPGLKTFVVRNGIEMNGAASPEIRSTLRNEVGIPADALVVGAVGRLEPRKNFALLIKALAKITSQFANVHLVMIGDGPLRKELHGHAASSLSHDRVHFLGSRLNASSLFPLFDIFCFPSGNQEGLPNVLMEAASKGIPAVATEVGGVSEVVENGRTGFTVRPDDHEEMASRIAELLAQPSLRRQFAERGRLKMFNEFGVDTMVTNMERVYDEVTWK